MTDGNMVNSSFLDYRMPTTLDLPMIDTVLVEVPNPGHPYGVRGVGEVPIVPPPAAVANAIYRATGKRMTHAAHVAWLCAEQAPGVRSKSLWRSSLSLPCCRPSPVVCPGPHRREDGARCSQPPGGAFSWDQGAAPSH